MVWELQIGHAIASGNKIIRLTKSRCIAEIIFYYVADLSEFFLHKFNVWLETSIKQPHDKSNGQFRENSKSRYFQATFLPFLTRLSLAHSVDEGKEYMTKEGNKIMNEVTNELNERV